MIQKRILELVEKTDLINSEYMTSRHFSGLFYYSVMKTSSFVKLGQREVTDIPLYICKIHAIMTVSDVFVHGTMMPRAQ